MKKKRELGGWRRKRGEQLSGEVELQLFRPSKRLLEAVEKVMEIKTE